MKTTVDMDSAAQLISNGGIVAFPTETVYGLGANALDADAVLKIFETKQRPRFNPLIVHIENAFALERYAHSIPAVARRLADHFWPGPLTMVFEKRDQIPEIVTAGLSTIALRVPNHPVALELLRKSGVPIAAPSANRFGRVSPTTSDAVSELLNSQVPVLEGGSCEVGIESTIVAFDGETVVVLRQGGTALEELERVAPSIRLYGENKTLAPGMLKQHYAPMTRLQILEQGDEFPTDSAVGILSFGSRINPTKYPHFFELSETQDLREAARKLFAGLRYLDREKPSRIYVRRFPEEGLGAAMNDRIERASQ